MNNICTIFKKMADRIKVRSSKIVLFGSGVLGQVTMPQVLKEYGLLDQVSCYIDNDSSKWGTRINIFDRKILILSPEVLNNYDSNTVILLNISRFSSVLEQLESMKCTKDMDCYITGMMCIHNFCLAPSGGSPVLSNYQIIPKKLHYMWLGKKEMPENLKLCIESWRKYCPDYEIIEWNEDNYDFNKHPYMREAYSAGAYGFVPDYARLDILFNEGGIYLDTDVELKRNIDPLLFQDAFCGVEKWQVINFGGCSGAVKGNKAIRRFLYARENLHFIDKDGKQNRNTCGFYDTKVAIDMGYKLDGTTQNVQGMNIYASDYFQPYDYMSGNINITDHTYSVHWFNGGWLDEESRMANQKTAQEYNDLYKSCLLV
ncbi:glycosyltransferase family 32 protein [Butyrivibrio sp. NC3005]|uniref:glycosyltransferase family 32 protein n=1 Tax=Butyrivibrio sp. NC3005 TaxID=1280685 RepID=UPI00042140B5|nr:glycosyltransferase [Butyrivibrio sp. NC3005]